GEHVALGAVWGQHTPPHRRRASPQASYGLAAAHFGHAQAHKHYIRLQRSRPLDRFRPSAGLADHLEARVTGKHSAQPATDDGMIVHDQETNRMHCVHTLPSTGMAGAPGLISGPPPPARSTSRLPPPPPPPRAPPPRPHPSPP